MKSRLMLLAMFLATASASEAQVYYPIPGAYPIQPVYYYPAAWTTMTPQPSMGQRVYFGGAMTTRGVVPMQSYFANLHREAQQMEVMRQRQAPGTALPPVLPPNLPPDAVTTPTDPAPGIAPATPSYLQQLFEPNTPPRVD